MSGYGDFAYVYDRLMDEAEYDKRAEYLLDIFSEYDRCPSLMLDLACGTGNITARFQAKGIDMIGVDCSEDMLAIARENHPELMLLCQDAAELELYGTVDGAICCLDSLNHITDYADFKKAIARTALFLEPGRLFVFDLNTVYKHDCVLADNTFVKEYDDLFCVWQNFTDETHLTEIDLDFFTKSGNIWERSSDSFAEKGYTEAEISAAIAAAGLEIVAVFNDMTFDPPADDCQRAVYVTRRTEK